MRKLVKGGGYDAVLFCENSGARLDDFKALIPTGYEDKVEFVSAPPNIFPSYLKKSNEFGLIDYACDHSSLLRAPRSSFFKVTGRYSIRNIGNLLSDVRSAGDEIVFYCDQKDHRVYSCLGLNWCQQNGEMRYIYMSVEFWRNHFYGYFAGGKPYEGVEPVVFRVAQVHYKDSRCRFRFKHEARFKGFQGQQAAFLGMRFSPQVDYWTSDIRWLISSIVRRIFPKWWF